FGPLPLDRGTPIGPPGYGELVRKVQAMVSARAADIEARIPKLSRRVGGYNIDRLLEPSVKRAAVDRSAVDRSAVDRAPVNMADLLVGSEGTLAWTRRVHLQLSPLPT